MIPLGVISASFQTGNTILHIVLVALFVAYVILLSASRLEIKVLKNGAICILLAGIGLYFYGYSLEDYVEGPVTTLMRSTLSSMELFVSHSDLLEIERAQEKPYFLDLFIFVYSCAVVTSISTILSLFAKRVISLITMRVLSRQRKKYDHVFFGLDHNAINLAKNIDKSDRIAFIEFPSDEKEEEISLGSIIQNVFHGIVVNNGLDKDNVSILKAKRNFNELAHGDDMLKQMGLSRLKELVDDNTIFYILSDDAEKNILEVMTLVSDEFFRVHTIQCHAYKKGLIRQYQRSLFDTHVQFFYPDTTSVLALREDPGSHPVNTMDIPLDADGKSLGYATDKSFKAMICGFSESGMEILKFIYKYSSFIGPDKQPLPVKCYIQDPDMDLISGTFKATVPALESDEDIVYETVRCLSEDFWNKMKERLDDLKYIVFSSDDDTKNLSAATQVLNYALKKRKRGAENLKILVHIVESNDITDSICKFYNKKAGGDCLLTYGDKKLLFSPKWLVSGDTTMGISAHSASCAEAMHISYTKGLGTDTPTWAMVNETCEKARENKNLKVFLQQIRIIRQYIDDAFYSSTISRIGKGYEDLLTSIPVTDEEFAALPETQKETIDNISRNVHLFWCRQMALDGYTYSKKTVETEKTNEYLRPWDDLAENDKQHFRLQAKGMFIYLSERKSN